MPALTPGPALSGLAEDLPPLPLAGLRAQGGRAACGAPAPGSLARRLPQPRPNPWDIPGLGPSPVAPGSLADQAVSDGTRPIYLRVLGRFKAWFSVYPGAAGAVRQRTGNRGTTTEELDRALDRYLGELRARGGGSAEAGQLLSAVAHAYPHLGGCLSLSQRAARGFARAVPPAERDAITWGTAGVLACAMRRGTTPLLSAFRAEERGLAALVTLTSFDGCLREQDWSRLRWGDVAIAQDSHGAFEAAFRLGATERGERTKTGANEGVVIRDFAAAAFVGWAEPAYPQLTRHDPGALVFAPLSEEKFRRILANACRDCGLPHLVPHVLRHGGATHYMQVKGWGAKDVALRGRWRGLQSVRRYAKPHVLLHARALLPPHIRAAASQFERDPRGAWASSSAR